MPRLWAVCTLTSPDGSARQRLFDHVLDTWGAPLRRLVASYEFRPAMRDELYQEVLLALWRALPKLRDQSGLRAYVFRIAHNRSVSHVAGEMRRADSDPISEPPAHPGPDPHAMAEGEERRQRLANAVARLPLGQRQAVTLFLEGLSHAEVAEVLGISDNNVAVRINRARQTLAKELSND